MGRQSGHEKPFIRKGGGKSFTYKWGPIKDLPKDMKAREAKKIKPTEVICDAQPGSQGVDNNVTYVYKNMITSEGPQKLAYVECDYVS